MKFYVYNDTDLCDSHLENLSNYFLIFVAHCTRSVLYGIISIPSGLFTAQSLKNVLVYLFVYILSIYTRIRQHETYD